MNRPSDREKKRYEYVVEKTTSSTKAVNAGLRCATYLLITVGVLVFTVLIANDIDYAKYRHINRFYVVLAIASYGMFIVYSGTRTLKYWKEMRRLWSIAKSIPYVPPVTADTLPAEEVLVRGADEPSAPSETLLRATVKGEEAKAEELLRSSQGG